MTRKGTAGGLRPGRGTTGKNPWAQHPVSGGKGLGLPRGEGTRVGLPAPLGSPQPSRLLRPEAFSRAGADSKPRAGVEADRAARSLFSRLHPAQGRGLWAGSAGRSPTGGTCCQRADTHPLPRLQAPGRCLSSASFQRFLLKELSCLEKATCELHLFSLQVNNSIYSAIFRNLYNYCMRHAANYMYCRSEMGEIGRIRVVRILGRIYFHTMP